MRLGESRGMQHRIPIAATRTLIAPIGLALCLAGALWPQPARANVTGADVIEIADDGTPRYRVGFGAVDWKETDVAVDLAIDSPETLSSAIPAHAVTPVIAPRSPRTYGAALVSAAAHSGISPALLEALVWQESRWRADAVSPVGAIGLGQLMPGTARDLGVNPYDPVANLYGAARYLRRQFDSFGGRLDLALAAYNAGPGRVAKAGGVPRIAETQEYVRAVTRRLMSNLSGDQ